MDKRLWRRMIPVLAFKLSILAFALALVTILTGVVGNSPNSSAILTFNISSLGLEEYHDAFSPLHANITALVPSDITNPPSITRYLGAHDWYTMHYFSNCSGFYAPSTHNPSILTANKINITCSRQGSGYIFYPYNVTLSQLLPSVSGIADQVSTAQYMTSTWISLWYSGMTNCAITIYTLPWNFLGQRLWLNKWACWDAFITTVLLMSSSAMVTNTIITVQNTNGLPGPNPGSPGFLGVMWTTTTLMAIVCALMLVQYNLEGRHARSRCRAHGRRRGIYADAIPLQDRKSDKTLVGVENVE